VDLLRGSWRRRQQVREEVRRKLTTSRGSYEELVPVEFGLDTTQHNTHANLAIISQVELGQMDARLLLTGH